MYVIDFPDPETPNIWGGVAYYDLDSTDAVIDAYVDFVDHNHEDKNSSTMLSWLYDYSGKLFSFPWGGVLPRLSSAPRVLPLFFLLPVST